MLVKQKRFLLVVFVCFSILCVLLITLTSIFNFPLSPKKIIELIIHSDKDKIIYDNKSNSKIKPNDQVLNYNLFINDSNNREDIHLINKSDNGVELSIKATAGKIVKERGFNLIELQLFEDSDRIIRVFLNDSSISSFPHMLIKNSTVINNKSEEISIIQSLIDNSKYIEVICFVFEPSIFQDRCSHNKCEEWLPLVSQFYNDYSLLLGPSKTVSDFGFGTNIIIYQ